MIRQEFIPVWIDIRSQAWPEVPAITGAEWQLMLDDERQTQSPFFKWFYARTYILSPDGLGLYNLQAGLTRRYQPEPDLYKKMLKDALLKHQGREETRNAAFWRFWRL